MSIDSSWTAKQPGVIPLAMLRAALEKANQRLGGRRLRYDGEDDEGASFGDSKLAAPGAVFDISLEGVGELTAFQPNEEHEHFHLGLSTSSTDARKKAFVELFEAADLFAGCLGLVIENDGGVNAALTELAARRTRVDVRSVRVEIGLATGMPRKVAIEGACLASIEESRLEALEVATLRAVSFALEGSSRAEGKVTLEDLVAWADEGGFRHESTDGNTAHFEAVDEQGEVHLPLIIVTVSDRDVDITAYPEMEIDFEHALELNFVDFRGAAKLALDGDGGWCFSTVLRRQGLDRAFFLETLREFAEDLEEVMEGHGGSGDDEEGEAEDEDAEDEDAEDEDAEDQAEQPVKLMRLERYSRPAKDVIVRAQKRADKGPHAELTLLHILGACLELEAGQNMLKEAGANFEAAQKKLAPALLVLPKGDGESHLSVEAVDFLVALEREIPNREIGFPDVLRGLVRRVIDGPASQNLRALRRVVEAGRLDRIVA